jgi:hypothetical protein
MSGLMRRLNRESGTDDEATPQATDASTPVTGASDAQQGGAAVPADGQAPGEATAVLTTAETAETAGTTAEATAAAPPADAPASSNDLPAGIDPAELAAAPDSSARRGRVRRRLRYLRAVRELLLRDLGGFVAEAQRSEAGLDAHRSLLETKARRLTVLDTELRALESRLGDPHREALLRQPGVGGTCAQCGELHASDGRFCSRCGAPLTARAARERASGAAATSPVRPIVVQPAGDEPKETTASLWGRPKRPSPEPAKPASPPAGGGALASGDPLAPPPATPPLAQRAGTPNDEAERA